MPRADSWSEPRYASVEKDGGVGGSGRALVVMSAVLVAMCAICLTVMMGVYSDRQRHDLSNQRDDLAAMATVISETNAYVKTMNDSNYHSVENYLTDLDTFGSIQKFGSNPDIDTGTLPEDIWNGGGMLPYLDTAETMAVTSSNETDTYGGFGAWDLFVVGVDANWTVRIQRVPLNGLTAVNTSIAYLRIIRAYVEHAGDYTTNVGTLTITGIDTGTVMVAIPPDYGQTQIAATSVPDGRTAYLAKWQATMIRQGSTSGAMATVVFQVRENADNSTSAWRRWDEVHLSVVGTSYAQHRYVPWKQMPARTDMRLTCTYVSDSNTRISGGISLFLVRTESIPDAEEIGS